MNVLPASMPLRVLEGDGDGRAFAAHALNRDADGHQRGEHRNDPDDRDPQALLAYDDGLRQFVRDRVRQPLVACVRVGGVPDQAGIEGFGREHRQHHDGGEEQHARRRRHRHQRLQLHQRDGERGDEHVEHRPAADEFHDAIESRALVVVGDRAALDGDQQVGERRQLAERDHHARDQHDQRQRPRSRRIEKRHAAQDRVALGGPERGRVQHRQRVRRDVADRRGDDRAPRWSGSNCGGGIRAFRRSADSTPARSRSRVATAVGTPRTRGVRLARRSRRPLFIDQRSVTPLALSATDCGIAVVDPRDAAPEFARIEGHHDRRERAASARRRRTCRSRHALRRPRRS